MIETIATGAVAVLTPYLLEAGKGFANKAGAKLSEKAGEIYRLIKDKFKGDEDAEGALSMTESKPESKARQTTLQEVLIEKLSRDDNFAAALNKLLDEAKAADIKQVIAFDRGVGIAGDANDNIIVTGNYNSDKL